MRGLKHILFVLLRGVALVAPYVGAWIETNPANICRQNTFVAPYVGAWIETNTEEYNKVLAESHPTWVRGLKQDRPPLRGTGKSRTLRGCVD